MIDLHSHILPEIDDGPSSIEEAVLLVELVVKEGISTVVATPHFISGFYEPTKALIRDKMDQLAQLSPCIRIIPGAEIYLDHQTLPRILDGQILTLGDSAVHLLVELPLYQFPLYGASAIKELVQNGFVPILAHPERTLDLIGDLNKMRELRDCGLLFQIDADSIVGKNGVKIQKWVRSLFRNGFVDFVASDCHSVTTRPPQMRQAISVALAWGWDIEPLVTENPNSVLIGEGVIRPPRIVGNNSYFSRIYHAGRK